MTKHLGSLTTSSLLQDYNPEVMWIAPHNADYLRGSGRIGPDGIKCLQSKLSNDLNRCALENIMKISFYVIKINMPGQQMMGLYGQAKVLAASVGRECDCDGHHLRNYSRWRVTKMYVVQGVENLFLMKNFQNFTKGERWPAQEGS